LERLINWQIEGGTDAILVCGSTGEGLLISEQERTEIIKISREIANGRVPLLVGCSSASTAEAVKMVKQAEELKAEGALVIAPYYVKPTQDGIIKHFIEVNENTNIPIILYNNPGRCAVSMSIDTVIALSKLRNIVALKDSDTDLSRVSFIKEQAQDFRLLSGDDPSLLGYLAHGGCGAISVTANIAPRCVKGLIGAWRAGNIAKAQEINNELAHLSKAAFIEPNPIPAKCALHLKGLIANELRSPLTPANESTTSIIKTMLAAYNYE
jgi:4-hydroxy-tetrahydrodipicolinate synthase